MSLLCICVIVLSERLVFWIVIIVWVRFVF